MSQSIKKIEPLSFPWQTEDPFLFCVHHRDEFPVGNEQMKVKPEYLKGRNIGSDFVIKDGWRMYHGQSMPGFPHHPHRGFETITINKEGVVDHTDSIGGAGRFMEGDVQWMTAGKGINHSEMFPLLHSDKPNTMEIFQIWLNLPSKSKMVDPYFKMLWKEEIPVLTEIDKNGHKTTIDIVSGQINQTHSLTSPPDSWAANPENNVSVFTIVMEAEAEWTLNATASNINRTLYFYYGDHILVNGTSVSEYHRVVLKSDEDIVIKAGKESCKILILEGKPIGEPVAQYGPFVMNTQDEIRQAMSDYQRTQFGGWPWPDQEYAHPKSKGRFALHADGREEIKD